MCEKEREREMLNMYFNCPEMLFLFLKEMTGALAPFSYLVKKIGLVSSISNFGWGGPLFI